MIRRTVTLPQLGLVAGTRVALGVGIGLLLGNRLSDDQRRAAGWALLAVGAISTLPLAADIIFGNGRPASSAAALEERDARREAGAASAST